ncbi:excalibur calcium-binding domain-containing protein [Arthrobacter sp. YD4]|uniref:excalibur calcium-binding domain-containing protein n=1 Tax=Arthrobacter sp. YD4 TaxID=3058043 RepID=UPI0025B51603|nr:excalibur calcium-binding domain-containing protein [Arthrobacter sp. YD4]MDN3937548.1 excalibur calcium-binding domain-containing protein [Arthrobacter sp. YD4]
MCSRLRTGLPWQGACRSDQGREATRFVELGGCALPSSSSGPVALGAARLGPKPIRPRTRPERSPSTCLRGPGTGCCLLRELQGSEGCGGWAHIYAGQPGYSRALDRDGDGAACEN